MDANKFLVILGLLFVLFIIMHNVRIVTVPTNTSTTTTTTTVKRVPVPNPTNYPLAVTPNIPPPPPPSYNAYKAQYYN